MGSLCGCGHVRNLCECERMWYPYDETMSVRVWVRGMSDIRYGKFVVCFGRTKWFPELNNRTFQTGAGAELGRRCEGSVIRHSLCEGKIRRCKSKGH